MQLTETRRESQAGYAHPPANQAEHFFEAQHEHCSSWSRLSDASFVYLLCSYAFSGRAKMVSGNEREARVRVPAIVFDYPRHSGATDEGMTNGPSTFAYLAFWPRGDTVKGITKPMKMTAWRGPGM
jgi:hypothetical protein